MGSVYVSRRCTLPSALTVSDCNLIVTITVPAVATGASMTSGFMLAYVDVSNLYEVSIAWETNATATLQIIERVAGVSTVLTSARVGPYAASGTWRLRAWI